MVVEKFLVMRLNFSSLYQTLNTPATVNTCMRMMHCIQITNLKFASTVSPNIVSMFSAIQYLICNVYGDKGDDSAVYLGHVTFSYLLCPGVVACNSDDLLPNMLDIAPA